MGKLTAVGVQAQTKSGRHGDGDGLHLHVRPDGRKVWVLRFMMNKRSRDMGLGAYPTVSLKQARQATVEARALIRQGIDPIEARKRSVVSEDRTFRAAAEVFLADRVLGWKNDKHAWQWRQTLEKHAYSILGQVDVRAVTSDMVLDVLRPIWGKTPETASRLRGRIEAILDSARARGWRSGENPARWHGQLAFRLPAPTRVRMVEHQPSLAWERMPAFMAALAPRTGFAPRALAFVILTAARSGEVRGMTWGEVDPKARTWILPASRTKMRRYHRVPLSAQAIAVLDSVRPDVMDPKALVFPGDRGTGLSEMTMTHLIRRLNGDRTGEAPRWLDHLTGRPIVPHGFRSTFRDWASEATSYPREVAEAALAHVKSSKVEAAYARSDLLERRRPMMEEWGAWCLSASAVAAPTRSVFDPRAYAGCGDPFTSVLM
ncbi:tyrosine-type recombinase/integrase [Tanticharoenia sakaeratensis]|uniref:Integrase family protein n=1 Tax=Tanticharoenia sakaeratensis NBRC 103193 TaxID=1231623 RepID=A0A0D6MI27_9PROT|nr:integrase arm-type DNA-binding domain-containing protein [Tanticharoenia sakaeratensis]GAN53166.1 integrase family protein [Tanticharoenia sakaeratensis NBRC 103193]GBQ23911.1 integrase [Tanticharoenia sakaeratensis NBRC 103193]